MPHLRCPPVWRKIGWDRRQASADQFSQLYASEGRPSIAPGEWNLHGRTVRFLLLTVPRLRTPHRAEDIGSALKGGVNVCQRQLVNEVLGPLVTEFVRNFGREGATPIQRGPNASLLGRVQAVKLIRHNAARSNVAVADFREGD
jgi:hypothetical protein